MKAIFFTSVFVTSYSYAASTSQLSQDLEALTADDACFSEGHGDSESCDLSLRQLRGELRTRELDEAAAVEAAAEEAAEEEAAEAELQRLESTWHHHQHHHSSCKSYGCHSTYHHHFSCQCNPGCEKYGNCCGDFVQTCGASSSSESSIPPSPPPPEIPEAAEAPSIPAASGSVAAAGVMGHPDPSKTYPTHKGFTLMLVEEFNEPLDLDSDPIWTWSDGGLSEGQVRFVKEQIKFSDGKMKIVAEPNPGIPTQSCSHAEVGKVGTKPLVSGEFRARYNQFRYGRYEVRMKAPTVAHGSAHVDGNFITTMFVYKDAKFKHWREIDFEITGDGPHSVTTNMLNANGISKWKNGIQESVQVHPSGNVRAQFHTYAFEWLPDSVTWYIDGKMVRQQRGGRLPIPDHGAKIMMNLWIFNSKAGFGGPKIHNNRYPMVAEYDWFRFYKWDGDTHYPCAGLGHSCLTADDRYLAGNNPCDGIRQEGRLHGHSVCHATCQR